MQILKKTGRIDKSNVYADTAPSVKTYDLDKLVRERKAISKIGVGGFKYNCSYCNTEWDNANDYYECEAKCFIKRYIPNFTRTIYPELSSVVDDVIKWNYNEVLLFSKSDPMRFCGFRLLIESEMISYNYGEEKLLELKLNRNPKEWEELVENCILKIDLENSK